MSGIKILVTLTLILFLPLNASAQVTVDSRPDFIVKLDDENIRTFLNEVAEITTGQRPEMYDDDVIDYFNNHISDKSEFKSVMRYQVPGFPTQDIDMKLNKEQYINTIVNGRHMLEDYQTKVDITDLKISSSGKSATFKTVTKEKGRMPFAKDPDNKEVTEMIPIEGVSECEQKLIVSFNNFVQMAKAECSTTISFDPFAGKPLIPN